MQKKLLLAFMFLILLSSGAVSEDGKTVLKSGTGSRNQGLTIEGVLNGAVGPFDSYCDGYGNPGFSLLDCSAISFFLQDWPPLLVI